MKGGNGVLLIYGITFAVITPILIPICLRDGWSKTEIFWAALAAPIVAGAAAVVGYALLFLLLCVLGMVTSRE
jgi:hypothetical protein